MGPYFRATDATAGGLFLVTGGNGHLGGARLAAAGAVATAVLRDGGPAGTILAALAAPINSADEFMPSAPLIFAGAVHVTIAGAGAVLTLYEA